MWSLSRWNPTTWASRSNERALANARLGATECSRRRVERAEVAAYLATRGVADVARRVAEHPA